MFSPAVWVGKVSRAELACERREAVLGGPDPLPATSIQTSTAEVDRLPPAARPIACLEHHGRGPATLQYLGCSQAREACADDCHVRLQRALRT